MSGIDPARVLDAVGERPRRVLVGVAVAGAVLPLGLPAPLVSDLALVFVYGILAFAAIVPIGYAGQLILSQGAFFGIGAYTYVKVVAAGGPPIVGIAAGVALTTLVAYVLGWPATRAHGIYLGIITLAFNELFVILLDLFPAFTGGSTGLGSPGLFPEVATGLLPTELLFYYLVGAVYLGVLVSAARVLRSELGWALLTVSEDRLVAESIGIDTHRYRLLSFSLAGAFCGLAGGLYAPMIGYISPTVFGIQTTIDIILTGLVGGLSVPAGSLFGALVVVLVPELLRVVSEFRLIIYGGLLILLLVYLPEGVGGWLQERR